MKTTTLSKIEFHITANELSVAEQFGSRYWIYVVSEIYGIPDLQAIQDPMSKIGSVIQLTPVHFLAQVIIVG